MEEDQDQKLSNEAKNPSNVTTELQPTRDLSVVQPYPQVGDLWEFKLPGKRKRTKEVGKIDPHPPYQANVDRPCVHWQRENKGRYTGISVERLMEFGQRVSTKAERDARTEVMMERARVKREQNRQATSELKG